MSPNLEASHKQSYDNHASLRNVTTAFVKFPIAEEYIRNKKCEVKTYIKSSGMVVEFETSSAENK